MQRIRTMALASLMAAAAYLPAAAHQHGHDTAHHAPSPYAGMERGSVKALSPEQEDDLLAGRGNGLALPAELNGYPGPLHVLELATPLQLSDEQQRRTEGLFQAMKAQAVALGERVLAEEATLDRLFADQQITEATLDEITRRAAVAQGRLRAAHLRFHLAMLEVLTPQQIEAYRRLRGYSDPAMLHPRRQ